MHFKTVTVSQTAPSKQTSTEDFKFLFKKQQWKNLECSFFYFLIFFSFFRFLICLVFRLNLIYSHFFLFNSVALISPAHPHDLCVESALSTPVQLLGQPQSSRNFEWFPLKTMCPQLCHPSYPWDPYHRARTRGRGWGGHWEWLCRKGTFGNSGLWPCWGHPPGFGGKSFSWGWNSRCSWKGGLGKDCIVVMDWEYPPPQPPHLPEPGLAGKAGISTQNTNNNNKKQTKTHPNKQKTQKNPKNNPNKQTNPQKTKKGNKTQKWFRFPCWLCWSRFQAGTVGVCLPLLPHRVNSVLSGVNSMPMG